MSDGKPDVETAIRNRDTAALLEVVTANNEKREQQAGVDRPVEGPHTAALAKAEVANNEKKLAGAGARTP
ncbi:MAG: hypothetical protein MK052_04045 [Alphaproteobacteria bacterium]|nr:hypothetical protein [Alphaproteobacteria bacterium]